MLVFAPSLLFPQGLVHSLVVVACCSDYSSNHNPDCSDYLGYLFILDLYSDFDSSICSDMHCPHFLHQLFYFRGWEKFGHKFYTKSIHEVMESGGWLVNQCLARSLSDNGNRHNLRASLITPLYLTVSHTSIKLVKCAFRFSVDNPWNWILLIICKVIPFNSKLFARIGGHRIAD